MGRGDLKKHTTHFFGCECRERIFQRLVDILIELHPNAEQKRKDCRYCLVIEKAKEMLNGNKKVCSS